jgi:EmrB/QacA subfamily drug resistance transporter
MSTFDGAAVQMALPVLNRQLGANGAAAVQWVMTAFLLVATATLLPAGRIGDLYGRDRAWRAGVAVFALASAACALMPGLWWLVAARAVQGAGTALITANAAPLLIEAFPDRRGQALGLGNVAIALGLVTGPPCGALLVGAGSWRLIFVVAVPIGALAWLPTRSRLPHYRRGRGEHVDVTGGLLLAAALTGWLAFGTFGARWGFCSARSLISIAIGVLAMLIYALHERGRRDPLLDLRLFADRMFLSGALSSMLGFAALFALTVAMPFFLIDTQERPLVQAGLLVGIVPVTLSIVAPIAGALFDRMGSRRLCTAALITVAVSEMLLSTVGPRTPAYLLAIALGLAGAGLGAFEAPNDADVLGSLENHRLGVGTATLGAMRNLGMTLGVALAATLLSAFGVRSAMLAGAAAAGLAAVAAALRPGAMLPRRARRGRSEWAHGTRGAR